MEFACLQHLDMIKPRLGFGEFDRISESLQKQYCKIKAKKFTLISAGWIFFLDLGRSSSQDCEATRFAIIEFKFNTKQGGSCVLGRSPDMTIRKVRKKHNRSQHYSCQYSMYL